MPLTPGSRLGSYEIVAALGAGGMGEVFRARDTRLGRDVAIKALPAELAADPDRLSRFEQEARVLASLSHPNIAAIHGLEEQGGVPHLVLELIEGETLAVRLGRGAMSPREAITIGTQIASAIEAAHERGIVHRDLKPGNVMLQASGAVKVLDFGLAKVDGLTDSAGVLTNSPTMQPATMAGVILGTAAYMSPEQARGWTVDRRSDVWSFGCVLYECLTGHAAFSGGTVSDLIARVLEREPDWSALPSGVPARVRDIVKRCLRKDAAERPRDIRDVRLELESALAGDKRDEAGREKSIAVLPFENLSDASDEYFADGITDEILNALAHVDGLRVAARSSCFAFKGRREPPRSIGEQLDVGTVLEGTVRKSGARLRITVQLVDTSNGYQVWSERYDRELDDVFEVQDEIASAIATRLRGSIAPADERAKAKTGTRSVEAYEMFLKGRALQYQRGGSIISAIEWFQRAIALDPEYAEALAWLSDSYRLLGTYGTRPASDVMPKSREAAERALAIDPNLPEALSTLADIEIQYNLNPGKAGVLWGQALTINPRYVRARCERAMWLVGPGVMTLEQADVETKHAAEDEPLNAWVAGMRSYLLGFSGRHDDAIAEANRAFDLSPESFFARYCVMQAEAWAGHYEKAIDLTPALLAMSGRHPWGLGTLCWALARIGETERAVAVFQELESRSRHEFVSPFWLSAAAAAIGRDKEADAYARRAIEERDPVFVLTRIMPQADNVWRLPGIRELCEQIWSGSQQTVTPGPWSPGTGRPA